jgi:signal transduction histidine kinase
MTRGHPVACHTTSTPFIWKPILTACRIRVTTENGTVSMTVEDRGGGIAPEDIGRLFTRFYRADGGSISVQS